jgi:protein-S-isoprenylcysteine O-methyltransferase Ste14
MKDTYPVVAGLCLIGLAVRTGYELLKKNGRLDTRNKAVFAVVFVAMCCMLASWPAMCPIDPVRLAAPGYLRWIGWGMVAVGLALVLGGLVQLRGLENIENLVTTGLYSRLRHPMYTGFILWILGWVLAFGAMVSLAIGIVCIANILYWRWLEESALRSQHGQEYLTYCQHTAYFPARTRRPLPPPHP